MTSLSSNIKKIRKLYGLNQEDFGRKFGASLAMQKSYETSKARPDVIYMEKLSKMVDIPITSLGEKEYLVEDLAEKVSRAKDREINPIQRQSLDDDRKLDILTQTKYISLLERENERLQKIIDINLDHISQDLHKILTEQTIARAEVRAFGEYQVMKDVKGDDHKRKEIMVQISKLIGANLTVNEQQGKQHVVNRSGMESP